MPRTTESQTKHNLKSWTDVSIEDIQRLHEHKASGLITRVWLAIKSYAWCGKECFPSIKSIAERIGYDLTQNYQKNIGRALKWLEDNGFIKRKHRRSKERFTLIKSNRSNEHQLSPNGDNKTSPNRDNKNTQEEKNLLNPYNPLKGETQNEVSFSGKAPQQKNGKKKPDRPAVRRRKRTRRATKEAYAKLKERIEQDQKEQADCLEAYKQGQQEAPIHLERIFREHQSKTTKDNKRAFFVALVASYFGLCEKPDRPDWFCSGIDLRSPENDRDCMVLYLDYFKLDYFLR